MIQSRSSPTLIVEPSIENEAESEVEYCFLDQENPDDAALPSHDIEKIVDETIKAMMNAAKDLPAIIRRGSIAGVQGSYSATKMNGEASRTTAWRRKTLAAAAVEKREGCEAAFSQNPAKKTLLTHFFTPKASPSMNLASTAYRPAALEQAILPPSAEDIAVQALGSDVAHIVTPEKVDMSDFFPEDDGPRIFSRPPSRSKSPESSLVETECPRGPPPSPERKALDALPNKIWFAPSVEDALESIPKLLARIRVSRKTGPGYKYTELDLLTLARYNQMLAHLRLYATDPLHLGQWKKSSITAAVANGKSQVYGLKIRRWCREFIQDNDKLPLNQYGTWNTSILHSDEDLQQLVVAHLQSVGPWFSAATLVEFLNTPSMLERMRRERPVAERTAQRWLSILGFRWKSEAKGMYSDGHEREDIVKYRQECFLPRMAELLRRSAEFDVDANELPCPEPIPEGMKEVIVHMHDESIFYAHDRRSMRWCHSSENPKPYAKGEGQSFMVADFVSAKLGWLTSLNGEESARVTLKPGKERDGYFSSTEVLDQLSNAMNILEKDYPQFEHVFVLDNARTHTKRAEDALSARRMPKNRKQNFGVLSVVKDAAGNIMHDQHGKVLKEKKPMANASFANGSEQMLYYPFDHPEFPGQFKGMTEILRERGFVDEGKLRAECAGFKCKPGVEDCCQRRILFNQPDFLKVPSLAESLCSGRGFSVVFLPKFHPELNFIEMCWGYAKRRYRETPPSSKIDVLERNAIWALNEVPRDSMRR